MGKELSQSKKLTMFYILEILHKYTDAKHTINQKGIATKLQEEYDITLDRKTIKSDLMNLIELGYAIEYTSVPCSSTNKKTREKEENEKLTDFYLVREFEDSELRLLIDSLLFSRHLPYNQCKKLIEKLETLSNQFFKSRVKHIATLPDDKANNKQLFYTIDILDEAIEKNKKVRFKYVEYDTDLKLKPRKNAEGKDRIYVVNPYQMVAKEGKYYLICNYDLFEDISNYRVDRIKEIELLDERRKPFEELRGSDGLPLNLAQYMEEHVYMLSSDTTRAVLRIVNPMITDMIEMFGNGVSFFDQDETHVSVRVKANEMSILQFAKNYSPDVIVLEPKELREKAIAQLRDALNGYDANK